MREDAVARKPTDTIYLQIRIAEGLRRALDREATKYKRSMNTEIIRRLDASFEQPMLTKLMKDAVKSALEDYDAATADQIIKRLRREIAQDRQNEKSLLGHVGRRTIVDALSEPEEEKQDEPEAVEDKAEKS
jgi:hypothetical protein